MTLERSKRLASYFEKSAGGKFGCTNWRLPFLKEAVKDGRYIGIASLLDGETSNEKFYLAEIRHFFVYLDHLGMLKGWRTFNC